ncbi:unnamed protein product [Coffea canephora]|uniref:DH200=94 genomic scaffold, scaffold_903 n=1 Tax=Coffea canephora TaxID=49390 RepID=A0A068VHL6_COFCA|nr:unnamed protein product [Coffea canephora]
MTSQFIVMLERGNITQTYDLFNLIRSELSMKDTTEKDTYIVEAAKASGAANSSVTFIQRYCDKLPRNKYVYFILSNLSRRKKSSYQCQLTLPPNAAFQTMTGALCRNTVLSKQLVCLESCKKLHQMGALTDHLLPISEKPSQSSSHPN